MDAGVVMFYHEDKGFGFIHTEGGDIYVRADGLRDQIGKGDQVEFNLAQGPDGATMAVDVKLQ